MKIFYMLFTLFLLSIPHLGHTQWAQSSSEPGKIIPEKTRPVLDAKIYYPDGDLPVLFPGVSFSLDILVKNTGSQTAEQCWVKVESDSPFLLVQSQALDMFTLQPGDSVIQSIPLEVRSSAPIGYIHAKVIVEENNGYHLFPSRNLSFYIEEVPDMDVVVSDVAVRDQTGVGYFEQFEDVEFYFRIKNCGHQAQSNINAKLHFDDHVVEKRVNPNYLIGELQPGDYRDISAVVSPGFTSENVAVHVEIDFGSNTTLQPFLFAFREDYKGPDMLSEDCTQVLLSIDPEEDQESAAEEIEPQAHSANKYAIILINKDYFTLDEISNSITDADSIANLFSSQMGYLRQHVVPVVNTFHSDLHDFENMHQLENLKRAWSRARGEKELTFYYSGYGSVDFFSGELYVLPINFVPSTFQSRFNIMGIFEAFEKWKEEYNITRVTSYFNISFADKSLHGDMGCNQFRLVRWHEQTPGYSTFLTSSFKNILPTEVGANLSFFTELFTNGMKGAADYNGDKIIMASDFHRFLSDELSGIPAKAWSKGRVFRTPVFLGDDVPLY